MTPQAAPTRPVPRVALTLPEAAVAMGISVKSLRRHVLPHVRLIRKGRLVLVPLSELTAWADREAARTLES
jgi:hypothetical protein